MTFLSFFLANAQKQIISVIAPTDCRVTCRKLKAKDSIDVRIVEAAGAIYRVRKLAVK